MEIGFWIKQFRFELRLPKIKLKKPIILNKNKNIGTFDGLELPSECKSMKNPTLKCSSLSTSSFASSTSSYSVSDFLQDLDENKHTVENTFTFKEKLTAHVDKTSTPLILNILPLNRMVRRKSQSILVHDVSGVKIYEDSEDTENKVFTEETSSDVYENTQFLKSFDINKDIISDDTEDGYEIVMVRDRQTCGHSKPRTLKTLSDVNLRHL